MNFTSLILTLKINADIEQFNPEWSGSSSITLASPYLLHLPLSNSQIMFYFLFADGACTRIRPFVYFCSFAISWYWVSFCQGGRGKNKCFCWWQGVLITHTLLESLLAEFLWCLNFFFSFAQLVQNYDPLDIWISMMISFQLHWHYVSS